MAREEKTKSDVSKVNKDCWQRFSKMRRIFRTQPEKHKKDFDIIYEESTVSDNKLASL